MFGMLADDLHECEIERARIARKLDEANAIIARRTDENELLQEEVRRLRGAIHFAVAHMGVPEHADYLRQQLERSSKQIVLRGERVRAVGESIKNLTEQLCEQIRLLKELSE